MEYQIPTRSFNIVEARSPIEEIYRLTKGFNSISKNTERYILSRICNRKKPTLFGKYNAPHKPIADKINGNGGYFLKKTTQEAQVDFIWHDIKNSEYLFWGSNVYKVSDAMNRIRIRIMKNVNIDKLDPIPTMQPDNKQNYNFTRETIANTPPPKEDYHAEDYHAEDYHAEDYHEEDYEKEIYVKDSINHRTNEEPLQLKIFRSIGERHVMDNDAETNADISDADIEYIAIVRESFKDDDYSKVLFDNMDNGTLSKSDFILQHEIYSSRLFEDKFRLIEKFYALANIKKN